MLSPMYPSMPNSPSTTINEPSGVGAGDTFIILASAAILPAAPNIFTIGYNTASPETIFYPADPDINNTLWGVTRGFQGVAQAWPDGAAVARVFTGYDYDTILANIEGLQEIPGPTGPQGSQGEQGTAGLQGIPGVAGQQGIQGTQGATGATGAAGVASIATPIMWF
jgi:hypothetical protein